MLFRKRNLDESHYEEPNYYVSFTDFGLLLLITFIFLTVGLLALSNDREAALKNEITSGKEKFAIRSKIGKRLKEELESMHNVSVDAETGVVTINDDAIRFLGAQAVLEDPKKTYAFLDKFIPKYIKAIKYDKEIYEKYVKFIVVEGHTSKTSSGQDKQMVLSLERANVIYQYIYDNRSKYKLNGIDVKKIQTSGRGCMDLRVEDIHNDPSLHAQNRRVEFHFTLDEVKLLEDFANDIDISEASSSKGD